MFLNRRKYQHKRGLDPQEQRQHQAYTLQGVNQDLPATQVDEDPQARTAKYTNMINIENADIGVRSILGHSPAYGTPIFPPEHLAFVFRPTLFYWLYASGDGIGVTDGQNQFDITPTPAPTSIYPDVAWVDTNINDFPVLNNGREPPWYWNVDTAAPMQVLPNWPANTVAGSIRTFNKSLIAMDITNPQGDFNNYLQWSNSAEPNFIPDSWEPLPENDAGFNTLSDTRGTLLDGQQFRDTFLLFKQHSTYTMQYIGGNFVFAFRKLFTTSGILARNCSAEYLGRVIVLTDGDLIITDGQAAESMIDKTMRDWLFRQIDPDQYQRCFMVEYHSKNQVWLCFPQVGENECTLALVFDANDLEFSIRELQPAAPHIARGQVGAVSGTLNWDQDDDSWESDITIWNESQFNPTDDALLQADRNVEAAPHGFRLLAINEGVDFSGIPIKSKVERIGLDFGDIIRTKLVTRIILRVTGNSGVKLMVRVGAAQNDSSIVLWNQPQEITLGEDPQALAVQVQGRFIAFSVESELSQPQWKLQGVEFIYNWQGRY